MKVFICWSGKASHVLAKGLHRWLQLVIQAVDPFISSESIDKGARWAAEVQENLASSNFGILCMTPENIREPWIHFEAGALTKLHVGSISAVLLGVNFSDLHVTLQQFQHTPPEKDHFLKLIKDINSKLLTPLKAEILKENFEAHWLTLEGILKEAKDALTSTPVPARKPREAAEMFEEVLSAIRDLQREIAPVTTALDTLNDATEYAKASASSALTLMTNSPTTGYAELRDLLRIKQPTKAQAGYRPVTRPAEPIDVPTIDKKD